MTLDFKNTRNDTETQYKMINKLLRTGVFNVEFTKLNGEIRVMPCTLDPLVVPTTPVPINEANIDNSANTKKEKQHDPETMSVWCTDKQSWRSFKTMRVISIKAMQADQTRWTATLEQDPETGELILPFPPDILTQVGWDFGDVLTWKDNNDGSWTLLKKESNG